MFGSSCDIHLEMPMGPERENESLDWWLIPPHQSKAIAKVNFHAMRAVNVTAFVRWAIDRHYKFDNISYIYIYTMIIL